VTGFVVTTCVLLHRDDRWLLTVRGGASWHGAGQIGLVGGRVEPEPGTDTLELNARREVLEETGVDLHGVHLAYLASEQFRSDAGTMVLDVTFTADVPTGVEPRLGAPEELTEVRWWSRADLEADPRCPPWLVPLIRRAEEALA
jgi:8-oxo-dGTP diphosphatase